MADTTNIDDLPSASDSQSRVVLEKQETPEYQQMIAHDTAQLPATSDSGSGVKDPLRVPSALENQKMMNELVSGIQQASASGATQLPSRDIPMNQSSITQDQETQPNYVPKHVNDDYIDETENMNDYMLNNIKSATKQDTIEAFLETMQVPILLGILYFMFQLPVVKSFVFVYFPSMFHKDGNQNLGGYLFFSILFAITYFTITSTIQRLEMV